MTRLVDDLLSLSRIELNEHVAPTGQVALAPLIEHGRRRARIARRRARHAARRWRCPNDLPDVHGDEDELAQVFQNLIDNAIKYGRAANRDHDRREHRPSDRRRKFAGPRSPSPTAARASRASICRG